MTTPYNPAVAALPASPMGLGWDQMTPAQKQAALSELVRLGQMNQESGALQDQIAQAAALRSGPSIAGQHKGGTAANVAGGLSDALRQILGVIGENRLRGDQKKLMGDITAARSRYGGLLIPTEEVNMDKGPKQLAIDDEIRPAELVGPEQVAPAKVVTAPPVAPRTRPSAIASGHPIPEAVLRAMGLL